MNYAFFDGYKNKYYKIFFKLWSEKSIHAKDAKIRFVGILYIGPQGEKRKVQA